MEDLMGVYGDDLMEFYWIYWEIPSGNLLHSYSKWPFIVDFPMKHGDFPVRYVTNYQRVGAKNGGVHPEMFGFYHLKNQFKHGGNEVRTPGLKMVISPEVGYEP